MKHRIMQVGASIDLDDLDQAKTLLLGGSANMLPGWDGTSAFNYVLRVEMIGDNLPYLREFALQSYRVVEISCAAYSTGKVKLLAVTSGVSSFNPVELSLRGGAPNPARSEVVTFPVLYNGTPTERAVPNGATQLYPAVGDAGFSWRGDSVGGLVSIPDPVVVGVPAVVKGPRFLSSVTPFAGMWEIEL